jgi:hypothetical protein
MGLLQRSATEPSQSTTTDNLGVDWVILYDFADIGWFFLSCKP